MNTLESSIKQQYGADFTFNVDHGAWSKITENYDGKTFNANTIRENSSGNLMALLTEHYFKQLIFGFGVTIQDKSEEWEKWDFEVCGRRIDVKSKRRNTGPRQYYDYHIDHSQWDHPTHHYVFSDVFYSAAGVYVPEWLAFAGWLPKDQFNCVCTEHKAGDKDGNFTEKVDCRKVKRGQLLHMRDLVRAMCRRS